MPAPTITPLPTPPSRGDAPETFNSEADAFLAALPTLQSEVNALGTWMDTTAAEVDADRVAAAGSAAAADGFRIRAGNTVPFATWTALAAATGMSASDKAQVLAADTGTHTDPVVGGTVNNAGVYTYSASPAGWQRTGNLDSQTAASSVGAVKQIWPFGTYNVTTAAWYFAPGLPVQTAFDRLRVFLTGTGTADIYIQANDVNILGPIAVTTTPTSNTISVTVPAGRTLSFQLANITGTPTAILGQMEGLPS